MTSTTISPRDYYEVLGVSRDADEKTIKNAFRRLALRYHPDRSTEPDAEARFKEIAEAYAVLSDPAKRADYDARGFAGVAGFSPEDLFGGLDLEDLFGPFGFDGGGLFERLFHPRRPPGPPRGRDIDVLLTVPLATVATGGEETVELPHTAPCGSCGGKGTASGAEPPNCPGCGGSGRRTTSSRKGIVVIQQVTTCPDCSGRGVIIENPCPECHGSGQVDRPDQVKVRIPAGLEEGTALRVPGHGLAAPEPGGVPGDAYIVVRSAPDPRFLRQGADLWRAETIEPADAVLGTERNVPTLTGEVTVRVAPGTQPGTVLRVAGRGLPRPEADRHGDLYVTVNIHIPERVGSRERRVWESLRGSRRA